MTTCLHRPPLSACTSSRQRGRQVVAAHSEQGWSPLCNGVVVFDDLGELLPTRTDQP